ncbi:MAG: hypothetical protein HQL14_03140 [Candidatus Omnitrophica bacterium]|nr:hypothetical protein [Candidatus Omnitrophota bacterium]
MLKPKHKTVLFIIFFVFINVPSVFAQSSGDQSVFEDHAAGVVWKFKSSNPIAVFTPADRENFHMMNFPDEPVGVVRVGESKYFFFGPSNVVDITESVEKRGPSKLYKTRHQGTYKFEGTLDKISPVVDFEGKIFPSLKPGRLQPSPDGRNFDRDYAGGGSTYIIDINGKPVLVHLYHGEYHQDLFDDGKVHHKKFSSYASAGIAIDPQSFGSQIGNHMMKLGEILSAHMGREDYFAKNNEGVLDSGTISWIEADRGGHHINEEGKQEPYLYVMFGERNSWNEEDYGFGLARALKKDVYAAIAAQKVPVFKKYYLPDGADSSKGNYFTEPAIGGRSTLLFNKISGGGYFAHPRLVYNSHIKLFMLSYMVNQDTVYLRLSDDLIHWSNRIRIAENAGGFLNYPALVADEKSSSPVLLADHFYLYYVAGPKTGHILEDRKQVTFMRRDIEIVQ